MRGSIVAALTTALIACYDGLVRPDGIELVMTPDSASVGESVTVTLTNATTDRLGYNLCFGRTQIRIGSEWVDVPRAPDRWDCLAYQAVLTPGQSDAVEQLLHAYMVSSEFRFVLSVEAESGRFDVTSDPIAVLR